MKKIAPIVILFLVALMLWNGLGQHGPVHFDVDGDGIDGPLGALLGLVLASWGVLIGAVVMLCVGVMLALLFVGLGAIVVSALAAAAALLALLVSPFMLPFLIPAAIVWFFVSRARRQRLASPQPA